MKQSKKKKRARPPVSKPKQLPGSQNPKPDPIHDQVKMAMQAESPAGVLPSAQVVGNAFVEQYYHILHQSPELVHKFYQDSSILSRPDANGLMSSVTTMQAIDEKIQSLDYKNYKPEIKTADAQDSHQSGVIVLVTGCLTGKDNVKRKFAQTFFLTPQEKGDFVQNDVFRFVEESAPLDRTSSPVENIIESAPADLPIQSSEVTNISDDNPTKETSTNLVTEDLNIRPEICELTQEVLESLFNAPKTKSSKHEPGSMNWRNVVKKMESLGQSLDYSSQDTFKEQHIPAKVDDYHDYRTTANQHWDSMNSYYHKAATAFADGKREYAAYLSDQGRIHNEKARQADERASQDIFNARNKDIENVITIDLHGQHVKQGMKLLKLHLFFGAYVRSVRLFRVITGCGSHGLGKPKIKQSVVNLLEAENIEWKEENRGTLLIKLNGQREFSFLDSGSDSD